MFAGTVACFTTGCSTGGSGAPSVPSAPPSATKPALFGPKTVAELCAAQLWPRPVPAVIGLIFDPSQKQIAAGNTGGALACWNDISSVSTTGQDGDYLFGPFRITAVTPPPGTPLERQDAIAVQIAPLDSTAPPAFTPCAWVTPEEAADFLGAPDPATTEIVGDRAGSVDTQCTYRNPVTRQAISSALLTSGAFPVDAASSFPIEGGSAAVPVSGLGLNASCAANPHGVQDQPYTSLTVLLDGERLYEVTGWSSQSCEVLQAFAKTALDRID